MRSPARENRPNGGGVAIQGITIHENSWPFPRNQTKPVARWWVVGWLQILIITAASYVHRPWNLSPEPLHSYRHVVSVNEKSHRSPPPLGRSIGRLSVECHASDRESRPVLMLKGAAPSPPPFLIYYMVFGGGAKAGGISLPRGAQVNPLF